MSEPVNCKHFKNRNCLVNKVEKKLSWAGIVVIIFMFSLCDSGNTPDPGNTPEFKTTEYTLSAKEVSEQLK